MGLQLVFVVETNKAVKSDWIYIKETIERFYRCNNFNIKLSVVYMGGRGNYQKKVKEVQKLVNEYRVTSKGNNTKVIYCFDCDEYDSAYDDCSFLTQARNFCKTNRYEFVWFCRDIEEVYTGNCVNKNDKKTTAENFKAQKKINNVEKGNFYKENYKRSSLNISNLPVNRLSAATDTCITYILDMKSAPL